MSKILKLMPALNLLAAALALFFLLAEILMENGSFGAALVVFGPLCVYGLLSVLVLRMFARERLPFLAEIAYICLSLLAAGFSLPAGHYFLLAHTLVNLLVMVYSHLPDGGPADL